MIAFVLKIPYVVIGILVYLATPVGLWVLSDFFYDRGLWPLGAIARVGASMFIVPIFIGIGGMILIGIWALITYPFRRG